MSDAPAAGGTVLHETGEDRTPIEHVEALIGALTALFDTPSRQAREQVLDALQSYNPNGDWRAICLKLAEEGSMLRADLNVFHELKSQASLHPPGTDHTDSDEVPDQIQSVALRMESINALVRRLLVLLIELTGRAWENAIALDTAFAALKCGQATVSDDYELSTVTALPPEVPDAG